MKPASSSASLSRSKKKKASRQQQAPRTGAASHSLRRMRAAAKRAATRRSASPARRRQRLGGAPSPQRRGYVLALAVALALGAMLPQGGAPALGKHQLATRGAASCSKHADCPLGDYCDDTRSCYQCSYITPSKCDAVDGDCCAVAFRTQCTANPRGCAGPPPWAPEPEPMVGYECGNVFGHKSCQEVYAPDGPAAFENLTACEHSGCPTPSPFPSPGPHHGECAGPLDCPARQYCDFDHTCYNCSYLSGGGKCDAVDGDCCSQGFLSRCPSNPMHCPPPPPPPCAGPLDCPARQYCDYSHTCCNCSYLSSGGKCDGVNKDCCSRGFLSQCPSNPMHCPPPPPPPACPSSCLDELQATCGADKGAKNGFWEPLKMILLSRQARDKIRKN